MLTLQLMDPNDEHQASIHKHQTMNCDNQGSALNKLERNTVTHTTKIIVLFRFQSNNHLCFVVLAFVGATVAKLELNIHFCSCCCAIKPDHSVSINVPQS
jgi:hypothetical protein